MASFVFELFPVGRQLKEQGLRGPRLGPALVFGHQSERKSVCPLLNPRLISWGNNAGLGGPSLDTEYELGRCVLLDWELHGSMGSHALTAKSVFHYVSIVPPTYFSLNLSLPSLFTPFPGLPLLHWTFSLLQGKRQESEPTTAAEPLETYTQAFSASTKTCPGSITTHWSAHLRGCYVCLNSQIFLQPWPDKMLSCPIARQRGIREGRRHVGTDSWGPLHWRLLL